MQVEVAILAQDSRCKFAHSSSMAPFALALVAVAAAKVRLEDDEAVSMQVDEMAEFYIGSAGGMETAEGGQADIELQKMHDNCYGKVRDTVAHLSCLMLENGCHSGCEYALKTKPAAGWALPDLRSWFGGSK